MSAVGTIVRKKAPISERIIQLALYVVISGFIATYFRSNIEDAINSIGVPIQGDFAVTMVSIAVGMIVTTILLYFMGRAYFKRGLSHNVGE